MLCFHLDFYLQKPSPGLCLLSLYLPWVPGIDFPPSPSLYSFLPFNPLILFNAILASLILIKKLCMIKQYSSLFFSFWVSFNPFVWVFWVFYTSKESGFIRCGIKNNTVIALSALIHQDTNLIKRTTAHAFDRSSNTKDPRECSPNQSSEK